jgi:O-acetyl-ADP-ribose deacetylase (regulator of RNase III)
MKKVKVGESFLELLIGDITKQDTDAIVNAANNKLTPGGGVSGAIHRAAGSKLWDECSNLGGCETGDAKITKGYNLPALYVIHTVGPIYSDSIKDAERLSSCYKRSLRLANNNNIKSISFPSISTGYFGYPIEKAAKIALETVIKELKKYKNINLVRFVLYDFKTFDIYEKILISINPT